MTEAQAMALRKVNEILTEHFEGSVVGVLFDTSDSTDASAHSFHGGRFTAIGLCDTIRLCILQSTLGHSAQDGPTTD